ncbi:MAG: DnaA regulatory inactivator Hda [Pseudomonadota bacterium]
MSSPQIPLGLRFPARQRLDSFHAGDNEAVLVAVRDLATRAGAQWVYLSGPEGAGKTHLLIAACQESGERRAVYLPLVALGAVRAEAALAGIEGVDLACIDDVQAIGGHRGAEVALFDAYNRCRASGTAMLFAGRVPPGQLPLLLPDLASRLAACTRFAIRPLDEAARRAVLRERARSRGFEVEDAVLDFLFRRHARDLGTLLALLDRVDRESLAAQRRITVPFLRRVMGLPSRDR